MVLQNAVCRKHRRVSRLQQISDFCVKAGFSFLKFHGVFRLGLLCMLRYMYFIHIAGSYVQFSVVLHARNISPSVLSSCLSRHIMKGHYQFSIKVYHDLYQDKQGNLKFRL